ncbi:MAG: L,D-transpeptidase [Deltaproteobacteria bacterium]|nr:L,D-transpeptidase [Deltaproteobacteria bacterium]MCB9788496.1 L,D-transpeptidase [Deltaproteobacteria bacterium]
MRTFAAARVWGVWAILAFGASACGDEVPVVPAAGVFEDLPVGELEGDKADGVWGHAVECKPIPDLPALADPEIVISLDGLTLHLRDRAGSYDRVFPIGPGAFEDGESLTPTSDKAPGGVFYTRTDLPPVVDGPTPAQAAWGWNQVCRMWWKNEAGRMIPVFAGLPFIRLQGPPSSAYAIHGPVDNYTLPSGGNLRRGFVSHGCVRMEAADVVEVYARILGHKTPVRVQKAVERREDGLAVDLESRWIGAECDTDADCGYSDGWCRQNPYSGRGVCTLRCDLACPDRAGYPTTFCVDEPGQGGGMCVVKAMAQNAWCAPYDHQVRNNGVPRHSQPSKKADVCLPGTGGWMGDRCLADAECTGGICQPLADAGAGLCTQACTKYCPDLAGEAPTFCVAGGPDSGLTGQCVAVCQSNDDCAIGTTCEEEPRVGQPSVTRSVCLPY